MVLESQSIEAKHLNTPRLVADETQTTVWKWDQQEPFGVNAANEDPDGNSVAFEFNLRFPGQYFDKETNAHYNYFRDYDPAIGRYVQSDPIGMLGGLNTYAYVSGRPLRDIDPRGLFNISLTGGYSQFFGIGGTSTSTGVAYGGGLNLCSYTVHCTRFGLGIASTWNIQGGAGTGALCSSEKWVTGAFGSGGPGLGGLGSVRVSQSGDVGLNAGFSIGGPNAAGGAEVCFVKTVCPNEPPCCKAPGGCSAPCVSGNINDHYHAP